MGWPRVSAREGQEAEARGAGGARRTCMIMPDVMMGEMPSSISVPRDEARIMRMM